MGPRCFVAIVGVGVVAACSSFGDADTTDAPTGQPDASTAQTDASTDGSTDAGIEASDVDADSSPFCTRLASKLFEVCDDFEDGTLLGTPWAADLGLQGYTASNISITPSGNENLLRIVAPPSTGAVAAFIYRNLGPISKNTVRMAATIQISGFDPADYVELVSLYQDGGSLGAGLALDRDSLRLYAAGAAATGAPPILEGSARVRRRIFLSVTSTELKATEVDATGRTLATTSLAVNLLSHSDLRFAVGLVYASAIKQAGTIEIDDVLADF